MLQLDAGHGVLGLDPNPEMVVHAKRGLRQPRPRREATMSFDAGSAAACE